MKVKEKLKAYVVGLIREESEELVKRQKLLEENVRDLNAQMENQEAIAENVRNLNAQMEVQEALVENVQNLNAQMEVQEAIAENVRNLNAQMEVQEAIAENVRNLNAQMEVQEAIAENVRNLNAQMKMIAENVRNLNVQIEMIAENVRNLNAQMEVQEVIAENVRNLNAQIKVQEKDQEVLEENVRNLNTQMEVQEAIAENVRNLNARMEDQEALVENVRNLNAQMEGQEAIAENVRNLNVAFEGYDRLLENVRNLNSKFQDCENIIENNAKIEMLCSTLEMQKVKIAMLEKKGNIQYNSQTNTFEEDTGIVKSEPPIREKNVYSGIDYFDFENHFRGSMQHIRETQEFYVKYFKGCQNVIDLGCGRGEFLELLKENDIDAQGVDLYEEFVQMCRLKELKVTCADAIEFLKTQQMVGGIFAAQLIEHLSTNQLVMLCELAYEKLKKGASIIMETPNPQSLSTYTNAFYTDPSHSKPVHPLTVQYILQKVGFKNIEIIYTDASRPKVTIPSIGLEYRGEFDHAMKQVENILFGSQDYAIIAKK